MEEIPLRDVIFLKKKLLVLIAQVLVISCLAGCERVPYWPTPWDTLCRMLPRIQEMTDMTMYCYVQVSGNSMISLQAVVQTRLNTMHL